MVFENFLNKKQLDILYDIMSNSKLVDGRRSAGTIASKYKSLLQYDIDKKTQKKILNLIFSADNLTPNQKEFHRFLGNKSCTGFQLLRYNEGDYYGWHLDETQFEDKSINITFTIFLNDDYDGGELEVETQYGVESFKFPKGTCLVYPAGYIHKVNEVTKGNRKVISGWLSCAIPSNRDRVAIYKTKEVVGELQEMAKAYPECEEMLDQVCIRIDYLIQRFTEKALGN